MIKEFLKYLLFCLFSGSPLGAAGILGGNMGRRSYKQSLIEKITDNYWDFTAKELQRCTVNQLDWILSFLEDKEGPDSQPGPLLSQGEKKALLRKVRACDFSCFDSDDD